LAAGTLCARSPVSANETVWCVGARGGRESDWERFTVARAGLDRPEGYDSRGRKPGVFNA